MPFHQNFDELYGRGEIKVRPNGWEDLIIEYGYGDISNNQNFYWRIKGSKHTFRILLQLLNLNCGINVTLSLNNARH